MTTTTAQIPQANLVPTIESTMLPSTPASEWAVKTGGVLAESAERVHKQAPQDAVELVPGSYPGAAEEELVPGAQPSVSEAVEQVLPDEETVQTTITSMGQRVKEMLPGALKAYLPGSNPPSSAPSTDSPPFLTEPAPTTDSLSTNLSTEAQAGSILPPRLDSMAEEPSLRGAPLGEATMSSTVSTNVSTMVHTGTSKSPNPISPAAPVPIDDVQSGFATPPKFALGQNANTSESRFIERLESESSLVVPQTTSPEQLSLRSSQSPSASGSTSDLPVHDGVRAPMNTLAPGAPDPQLTPTEGVVPTKLDTQHTEADEESDDDDAVEGEGDSEAKKERKRDRLVRKLKEKMHVGGGH
ncbi:hypothetical protein HMN09_00812200 [Mycena chlorophos]|uniref:Uncharacterized protein n=1 Tax=Mycena chlorophos TaxID=658473 RepID=A0A8H6SX93_MYCCL|nr:hypothetical protein HMN09_00812200 [Mycena chlorophos]